MLQRITGPLSYLRPRSLAKTRQTVDALIEGTREQTARMELLSEELRAQLGTIGRDIAEIRSTLAALTEREAQLRAIANADAALDRHEPSLGPILDAEAIRSHVQSAVDAAALHLEPFPYAVVENLFPGKFYDALVRGIPPVELFGGKVNKRQFVVPFPMGPAYGRRVWRFMAAAVAEPMAGILAAKFREPLSAWVAANWPELAHDPLGAPMNMHASDGRIMLRGRGYNIPPHRDPKWGFITCLIYLARPGDQETWGTALYSVEDDEEARGALPHWIKPERCRLEAEVPFRANSALIFLNSKGAHGASIPVDADPEDLERYAYQFRIGPNRAAMAALLALLPDDRRAAWAGKIGDY